MIDLRPQDLASVREILARWAPGREVRAFGSRVRGSVKPYSDLDLAVYGPEPLDGDAMRHLQEAFEEADLNFRVDVVDVNVLSPVFRSIIEVQAELVQAAAPGFS